MTVNASRASSFRPAARAFRVADHTCDPDRHAIDGPGGGVTVEPKVMQVLVVLAEHAGAVVTREQLLAAVWADTFVSEQVLSRAISELRKAFGDDARQPRVIETISRKGYRLIASVSRNEGSTETAAVHDVRSSAGRWLGIGAALVLVAVASWALSLLTRAPVDAVREGGPAHLAVVLPEDAPIELSHFQSFALSPDGQQLIYTGNHAGVRQLYSRRLDEPTAAPLVGTAGGYAPSFSPDGQHIVFFALGELKTLSLLDGTVRTVVDNATDGHGASWTADGAIVFARRLFDGLYLVDFNDPAAQPTRLTTVDAGAGERSHLWPHVLPDGRHALFTVWRAGGSRLSSIDAVNLETGERRRLLDGGSFPRYSKDGELLFARGGTVYSIPFDPQSLTTTAAPRALIDDAAIYPFTGIPHMALSAAGTLAYASRTDFSARWSLSWVDANGSLRAAVKDRRAYGMPRISPDERRLAASVVDGSLQVWLFDLNRDVAERFTADGENLWPIWTPDGSRIVFSSDRDGSYNLYVKDVDSDTAARRLTASANVQFAGSVSPDGQTLFYSELGPERRFGIWSVPLDGSAPPAIVVDGRSDEFNPALSPDGTLLAYASNEAKRWDRHGRWDIYLRPLERIDQRVLVSTGGGTDPTWSTDGRTLYYRQGAQLLAVDVDRIPTLRVGSPRIVLDDVSPPDPVEQMPHYDVTADGRFLLVTRGAQPQATQLNVLLR